MCGEAVVRVGVRDSVVSIESDTVLLPPLGVADFERVDDRGNVTVAVK